MLGEGQYDIICNQTVFTRGHSRRRLHLHCSHLLPGGIRLSQMQPAWKSCCDSLCELVLILSRKPCLMCTTSGSYSEGGVLCVSFFPIEILQFDPEHLVLGGGEEMEVQISHPQFAHGVTESRPIFYPVPVKALPRLPIVRPPLNHLCTFHQCWYRYRIMAIY